VRIVSLLPSATEIVCALGGRGDLVGRSHECDHPVGVADLPVLTRARIGSLLFAREHRASFTCAFRG
jgi:iron complex transport system substrate-binding protein